MAKGKKNINLITAGIFDLNAKVIGTTAKFKTVLANVLIYLIHLGIYLRNL